MRVNKIFMIMLVLVLVIGIVGASFEDTFKDTPPPTPVPEIDVPSTTPESGLDALDNEKIETEEDLRNKLGIEKDGISISGSRVILNRNKGSDKTEISIPSGGVVNINGKIYSNLDSVKVKRDGSEETLDPKIVVDKNGKVVEASFTTTVSGTILLGNQEVNLPANSKVFLENGVAHISYPKGNPPIPGEVNGDAKDETIFYFDQKDSDLFIINGVKIGVKEVGYYQGEWFIDQDAEFEHVNIKNSNKVKTYIFSDGKPHADVKGAYISMDNSKGLFVVGSNVDQKSPAVMFKEKNPYGILMEKGDHFAVQAFGDKSGSYVWFQNRNNKGLIPLVKTVNSFAMDHDDGAIYYRSDNEKFYLRPKGVLISEFGNNFKGSSTTPMEVHTRKIKDGKEVSIFKGGTIAGIGNDRNMGFGKNPAWIRTHVPDYYKSRGVRAPGLYSAFSNKLVYNYVHTVAGFEKFTGVRLIDQAGVTKNPKNIKMLMDIFGNTPTGNFRKWGIKTFEITTSGGWAGLSTGGGHFYVNANTGGFTPGVIIHEMAHMHDFVQGRAFENDWNSIGGSRGPHTYDYGYTSAEDTSTFREQTLKNNWRGGRSWSATLNSNYKYHAKFRARIAVFVKHRFMSRSDGDRLFNLAGLPHTDQDYAKYLKAGQEAYGKLG